MVRIVYVEPDGAERALDVPEGWTLMQGAVSHEVGGIEAECGGSCACATCHGYLDEATAAALPAPGETEAAMLDFTAAERRPTSRLTCQIRVTPALAGTRVMFPETQT